MTTLTFPSPLPSHRRADRIVHWIGLALILGASAALGLAGSGGLPAPLIAALIVYVLCALASNLASVAYHFAPWHDRRVLLRRIDHAAIYLSITGTFTPFFVLAGTPWTYTLLVACWTLTALAVWNKITNPTIKSKWSTASYLGLGAIGLLAIPDLRGVPSETPLLILAGSGCYVIGTAFYARKSMPYRYAIWHMWVNFGAVCMFLGVWRAIF